jgi:hypothetical protein
MQLPNPPPPKPKTIFAITRKAQFCFNHGKEYFSTYSDNDSSFHILLNVFWNKERNN